MESNFRVLPVMLQQRCHVALTVSIIAVLAFGVSVHAVAQERPRPASPRVQPASRDAFAEAKKMLDLGRHPRAVMLLSGTIKRGEHIPQAYMLRGIAYDRMGLPAKAVKDFTDYIARKPADPKGYIHRGDAQNFNLEHDAALKDYSKAIELSPKSAEAYLGRGLAHAGLGQYDDAIRDYRAALHLSPKNAEVMANIGRTYMLQGRKTEAVRYLEQALQHETNAVTKKQVQEWLTELSTPPKGGDKPTADRPQSGEGTRPTRYW